MSRPISRPRRAGYALILLTTVVGSASGAPPADAGEAIPATATQSPSAPEPATPVVVAHIPCISGTCAVLVPASTTPAPTSPRSTTPSAIARR